MERSGKLAITWGANNPLVHSYGPEASEKDWTRPDNGISTAYFPTDPNDEESTTGEVPYLTCSLQLAGNLLPEFDATFWVGGRELREPRGFFTGV